MTSRNAAAGPNPAAGFSAPVPLLPEILALHGRWRVGKPALICDDETLPWPEFTASYHRLAHALLACGIRPGDRVAVVMSNSPAMLQTLLAVMACGAVSVPINLSVTGSALRGMLCDAACVAVVASDDQVDRLASLRGELPGVMLWLAETARGDWRSLGELAAGQPDHLPDAGRTLDADALLNIIYSSGTTGLPKGIAHTHRGRRDWAYDLAIALRYHGGARTLLTIGLYSNISWVAMLTTLLAGGTLILHRRFDADEFLDTVERERVTHTAMVPVQFQRVVERQRERLADLSSMQAMMSCGSPLHEAQKRAIFTLFDCGVIELYGLTEGIITTIDPEEAAGRWNSVGRPLIGTDILIIDETGVPVPTGQTGEIVARGRITMPGYYRRPDADAEARYVDPQGQVWLRSGDIGRLDGQGFLYVVDRKKDMILSGGQNVYPQDIEAVLAEHPAVRDVAVIGVPSERWGETPIALAVLAPGAVADDILAWANERLGKQQRLADVLGVAELPRNPNGKLLKRELRQRYGDCSYA
jgi:acyl-CoA synthetase (AMP-forming)/AMP-acid ligase II